MHCYNGAGSLTVTAIADDIIYIASSTRRQMVHYTVSACIFRMTIEIKLCETYKLQVKAKMQHNSLSSVGSLFQACSVATKKVYVNDLSTGLRHDKVIIQQCTQ